MSSEKINKVHAHGTWSLFKEIPPPRVLNCFDDPRFVFVGCVLYGGCLLVPWRDSCAKHRLYFLLAPKTSTH